MYRTFTSALFLAFFLITQTNCGSAQTFAKSELLSTPNTAPVTAPEPITQTAPLPPTVEAPTLTQAVHTATATKVFLPMISTATSRAGTSVRGAFTAGNNAVAEFASIPQSAIDAAAAKRVLFYHQSTGGLINYYGLECLAGNHDDPANFPQECSDYAQNPSRYNRANWDWPNWPENMADAPAKMDQFVSLVPSQQANYDIIGMKFCYVDSWNQDFEQYRVKMEALEKQYPTKTFVWATSALFNDPGPGGCTPGSGCDLIDKFNAQLRAYTKANNKPLYDIADIESNGGACTIGDSYEALCSEWYEGGGGHPNAVGAIRLAKGFWWLVAKLSGWK